MAREPINTGSSSIAAIGNIASNYAQNVAIANSQTNGIFDRYLAHQKSLREEALANAKLEEEKKLNEARIVLTNQQTELAQKQNANFENEQARQDRLTASQIAKDKAAISTNYANAASINQSTNQKQDEWETIKNDMKKANLQNPPQTPPQITALDAAKKILPTEQY